MKLHVFNPEHDLSLAVNRCPFTPPKAVAQLKRTFDFLPIIWADHDDMILVNHIDRAKAHGEMLGIKATGNERNESCYPTFITPQMLATDERATRITEVDCWGIDKQLRADMLAIRPSLAAILPDEAYLENVRTMSARFWAAEKLIPIFRNIPNAVVEARQFSNYAQLHDTLRPGTDYVVKAPWSSSGRGVRLLEPSRQSSATGNANDIYVDPYQQNWIKNIIRTQGSIMIEPYRADKVVDFGVEFEMTPTDIHYLGLSIFKAQNGAYLGNLLEAEEYKHRYLGAYTDLNLLDRVINAIMLELKQILAGHYTGPLGIDMMLLRDGRINPMVELNLRRTMGHVAIHLYERIHRKGWMMLNVLENRVEITDIKD